jgi:hypothetical protein
MEVDASQRITDAFWRLLHSHRQKHRGLPAFD